MTSSFERSQSPSFTEKFLAEAPDAERLRSLRLRGAARLPAGARGGAQAR